MNQWLLRNEFKRITSNFNVLEIELLKESKLGQTRIVNAKDRCSILISSKFLRKCCNESFINQIMKFDYLK